jgi:hypothetical protein
MAKSKYDPDTFPQLAEGYAREGLTDVLIAEKLGIGKNTFYKYVKKHKDFGDSLKRGKAPVDFEVESSLLKSANGFTETHTSQKVTKDGDVVDYEITNYYPPNPTSIIFWLKNRKPEQWRDRQEIDHTSKGERLKAIEIELVKSPEDEK